MYPLNTCISQKGVKPQITLCCIGLLPQHTLTVNTHSPPRRYFFGLPLLYLNPVGAAFGDGAEGVHEPAAAERDVPRIRRFLPAAGATLFVSSRVMVASNGCIK